MAMSFNRVWDIVDLKNVFNLLNAENDLSLVQEETGTVKIIFRSLFNSFNILRSEISDFRKSIASCILLISISLDLAMSSNMFLCNDNFSLLDQFHKNLITSVINLFSPIINISKEHKWLITFFWNLSFNDDIVTSNTYKMKH